MRIPNISEDAGGSDNGFSVEAGGGGNDVGMSMAEVAAKLLGAGKAASKSRLAEILKGYFTYEESNFCRFLTVKMSRQFMFRTGHFSVQVSTLTNRLSTYFTRHLKHFYFTSEFPFNRLAGEFFCNS